MTKYVYITGCGHSGSTLLDLLLGAHSNVFSIGEISSWSKLLKEQEVCTCGKLITECSFWIEVKNEIIKEKGIDIFIESEKFKLSYNKKSNLFFALAHKINVLYSAFNVTCKFINPLYKKQKEIVSDHYTLYDVVRKVSTKNIVIDSSKNPLVMKWLWLKRPDEFKAIYLIRDGRGVLASYLRKNKKLESTLNAWRKTHELIFFLIGKMNKKSYLKVYYESLCSNPEKEIKRICEFIGIEFQRRMLEFRSREIHDIGGNRMRFLENNEIKLDEKWRKDLDEHSSQSFEKFGKKINVSLGYR